MIYRDRKGKEELLLVRYLLWLAYVFLVISFTFYH